MTEAFRAQSRDALKIVMALPWEDPLQSPGTLAECSVQEGWLLHGEK